MKNSVVLIGMPASGKSTVGVILAKALGKRFCDTDLLICEDGGSPLSHILEKIGIDGFLKLEEQIILRESFENQVVSTGGSVIYSESAIKHLKTFGTLIHLHISKKTMIKRIKDAASRGVVLWEGQSLSDLYDSRLPLYEKAADFTVDCENKNVEQIVCAILKTAKHYKRVGTLS